MLSPLDDDNVHQLLFLLLGWAAGWVRRRDGSGAAAGLVGYALASEAVQSLTFDRGISAGDLIYDLTGALIGLLTARLGGGGRPERSPPPSES